jgi:hypothetical protein
VLVDGDHLVAAYDGRATAEQNWEELTGTATATRDENGRFGAMTPAAGAPLRSPAGLGGLRYLSVLRLAGGGTRIYYEVSCEDGAHELRTELRA